MYTVKDILETKGYECVTIDPEATVYEALKKMAGKNVGALPVVKDQKVMGIFSERDYARKLVLMGKTSHESLVKSLMTDRVFGVKPETTINECMKLMTDNRVRHLPVVDKDQKLVGIISIGDVVNKVIMAQNNTISQLEDYIIGKR
ncbi:MAG: CBS domain-containing protein [Bacteroidota bacterium]|nr:MAG: CBS domain-containing protein [Bacteroidota bacterium]